MNPPPSSKLSTLLDCLRLHLPDPMMRLDRDAARVLVVESRILEAFQEGEKEGIEEVVPEWQRERVELARAMATDEASRFVEAPSRRACHERPPMGPFVRSLANADAASCPWDAMQILGGFRPFKDAPEWLARLEAWHAWRDAAMQAFVDRWAQSGQIALEDDTRGCPL